MSSIVKLFVQKIRAGEITLDEVPPRWKDEVQNILLTREENNDT